MRHRFSFDICKVMQRQYQTVENREVVNERSIVEADFYANRFKNFVFNDVFHPADDELATHPISMHVFTSPARAVRHDEIKNNDLPEIHRF